MQLKINNKIVEFEKIVAFGCSYTAGFETRDHVFFNISDSEMDRIKKNKKETNGFNFYSSLGLGDDGWNKLCDYNKEGSYVKFLADKFSVSWENFAEPGSSLEFSIWKLEEYLINNRHSNDLIIVGVTCPNRLMYLIEDKDNKTRPLHLQLNTNFIWPDDDFYNTYITTLGTSKNLVWKYYFQLKYLDMLNNKLGNRLLLVPMQTHPANWIDILDDSFPNRTEIKELTSIIPDCIDNYSNMLENPTKNSKVHPFLHPKLSVHQEFAENIYTLLMDDSNDS